MRRRVVFEVEWHGPAEHVTRRVEELGDQLGDWLDILEGRGAIEDPSVCATIEQGSES